jgi:hypothetical protein
MVLALVVPIVILAAVLADKPERRQAALVVLDRLLAVEGVRSAIS